MSGCGHIECIGLTACVMPRTVTPGGVTFTEPVPLDESNAAWFAGYQAAISDIRHHNPRYARLTDPKGATDSRRTCDVCGQKYGVWLDHAKDTGHFPESDPKGATDGD